MSSGSRPGRGLPDEAYAAALAGLPCMGPARAGAILRAWPGTEAWRRLGEGRVAAEPAVVAACHPDPRTVFSIWKHACAHVDVESVWRSHVGAGIAVHVLGGPGYPPALSTDHEAPAVLFSTGDLAVLDGRCVAIVGTRRCTRYGRDIAYELGRDLAAQGVRVVSGLALGVDGAAHAGALEAAGGTPVAVVGSGLDVVYPRRHRSLWASVAQAGVVMSEAPMGTPPESWRFPVRNRVIAALAEVVVVVESHLKGGSRHTVEAAEARGRDVMAVPGPVRSPASAYPNALLADGCHPVRDALDVVVALGLSVTRAAPSPDRRPPPPAGEATVLEAVGWEAASLEEVVLRTGKAPGEVSVALAHLERDGWVTSKAGWWERVSA